MNELVVILPLLFYAIFRIITGVLTHEPIDIVCGNVVNSYSKGGVENYCYMSPLLDVAVILPAPSASNVVCMRTLWDDNCIIEKIPTELFNKIKSCPSYPLMSLRVRKHKFDKRYTFVGIQEDE